MVTNDENGKKNLYIYIFAKPKISYSTISTKKIEENNRKSVT